MTSRVTRGTKINLPLLRTARTDLVLDRDSENPAVRCVSGRDFQSRDCGDFAQLFPFLIAKMKFPPNWDLAHLTCASRERLQGRRRNLTLCDDPTNNLLRIGIYGIGLHSLCSLAS